MYYCKINYFLKLKLNTLKDRVEKLERTHNMLEVCNSEITSRNQKIKTQLSQLIDKEKNLENLLVFALKNFAPNVFLKNELKHFENLKTDTILGNSLVEVNKGYFN